MCYCFTTTRMDLRIKRMLLVNLTHGLFLTWTQKSHYIYRLYVTIFTWHITPRPIWPLALHGIPALLTWRTSFFARGDEYPSTVVSGLPTTAPPPLLCPSHPFTPHSSNYIIYIDNISNLGRLRPGQLLIVHKDIATFHPLSFQALQCCKNLPWKLGLKIYGLNVIILCKGCGLNVTVTFSSPWIF